VRLCVLRNSPAVPEGDACVNYLDTMCGNGAFTMMPESPDAGTASRAAATPPPARYLAP
jgi:hypothetical protein